MRTLSTILTLASFALLVLAGMPQSARSATPEAELAVITNMSVAVDAINADELAAIFRLSKQHWGNGQRIVPFNYAPNTELREAFDRHVLQMEPTRISRYWLDRMIRGESEAPRKVSTPDLMAKVIAKLPGSIGYVPRDQINKDVRVVARVVNGQVMAP
jgi:ABC-type phosphate transport system substrate-binding protein